MFANLRRRFFNFTWLLSLCFLLAACSGQLQTTSIPIAQITTSPTATSLPLSTETATRLPSPTPKPTANPTSRSQPTFTPEPPTATAVTGPDEEIAYHLRAWTPAQANELDAFLQTYPDTLGLETSPYWGTGEYWDLFHLPALVKLEAIHRFPAAEDVDTWLWSAAYDLGRSDGSRYLDNFYPLLISSALNEGDTTLTELPVWWQQHEPHLTLTLTELAPFPGNRSNHILFLDGLGGAYYWLVESDSGFHVYPITALLDFYQPRPSNIQFGLADITGDSLPEAIAIKEPLFSDGRGGATQLEAFDLSRLPPQQMHFNPPPPDEFITGWSPSGTGNSLSIITLVDGVDCPLESVKTYQWNGQFMEIVSTDYPTEADIAQAERPIGMDTCVWYAEADAFQSAAWGDTATMEWIEANLSIWPPAEAPIFSAESYPEDIQDQLRFRLGLYHAFVGDYPDATRQLSNLIFSPIISTTQTITLAQEFLSTYTSGDQLAVACQEMQICYDIMPLPRLVELIPANSATPLDSLQSFGTPIEASGSFDIEHDQQLEHWFLVRDKEDRPPTLWVLAHTADEWHIVPIGRIADGQNHTLVELPPTQDTPVFNFLNDSDQLIFSIERDHFDQLLAVNYRTNAQMAFDSALNGFILGQPAEQIRDMLLDYGQIPYQDCFVSEELNLCPDLLYLQGLSYELSGDEEEAVETYLQLWRTYPESPYVFIVRAKLES